MVASERSDHATETPSYRTNPSGSGISGQTMVAADPIVLGVRFRGHLFGLVAAEVIGGGGDKLLRSLADDGGAELVELRDFSGGDAQSSPPLWWRILLKHNYCDGGGHMTKIVRVALNTTALLALAFCAANFALAQGKKDEAFGADVSSQCAQMKDPRVKDDCVRRLRGEAQIGSEKSWQGPASGNSMSHGVGSPAGGQGKGRR